MPGTRDDEPKGSDLTDLDGPERSDGFDVGFDPDAPEPIDRLPLEPQSLVADLDFELDPNEPEGTALSDDLPRLDALIRPSDDLEDFSTQEEVPMLPWSMEAELLEIGEVLPAVLEPTLATTRWERPGSDETLRLTVRLRMVQVTVPIACVDGPEPLLRVGRDVLAGRVLILVE